MQIAGASAYLAQAASARPVRSASPGVSPDLRPSQPPAPSARPPGDTQSSFVPEGADKPAASGPPGQGPNAEASPEQQRLAQLQIAELVSRDREVRAHEQAHAAVGGGYTGVPSYTYSRGPDGLRYAVGGEVGIDVGAVPNDPEATLRKMEVVLRAALAPAEPSAADLRVAAQARAQRGQARAELAEVRRNQVAAQREEPTERAQTRVQQAPPPQSSLPPAPGLDSYRQVSGQRAAESRIDLRA
jgi:hypothetical protein